MEKIVIKSPTRVDLAGGTLDLWPLYLFVGGATTVNVAIDVYSQVELQPREDLKVILKSKDINFEKSYNNLSEALNDPDPKLILLRKQLQFWKPTSGFELSTQSNSPVGAGIGGSSSMTISLMKAFSKFCKIPFSDVHELVNISHNIEAEVLNTPTGTQDYYPAAMGGMNIIHYSYRGITHECIPIGNSVLASHFLLVYTGKTHHSGMNNFEVMKAAVGKNPKTINALKKLRDVGIETEKVCHNHDWQLLPELFRQEYAARIELAPEFSSPEIEKLADIALHNGALAVKICGAGGGGCVLIWCPPEFKNKVADLCTKADFQVMSSRPVEPLTQALV